jgi:PAS domain S-box-containing protein
MNRRPASWRPVAESMATPAASGPVRVLHLEDNENDHFLVEETLQADGLSCEFVVAKTRADFEVALQRGTYDLIISDYTLPSFDGMRALSTAQQLCPATPFIFFSGTIGEDVAVESLKNGAVDYVLKQRPGRLTAAVRRALHNAAERARLQRTEQALQQSEERFRIVARASNDVIWDWDVATRKIWFSENFQNVFGWPPADVGSDLDGWHDLIHPDDKGRVITGMATLLASGAKIWWSEHRVRRADGSYAHIFDRASIIYDPAGKPVRLVGVAIDITERKEAEEKIREQAALLDKASDAIILCDMERRILFWNQGAERIYGWTAAEAAGKLLPELLFGGSASPEIQEIIRALDQRGEWGGELRELRKDKSSVIVQARATLIRDEQGKKSLLLINTDITERKQLEEQFLRAQRLDSLGILVSGIAHDLNNALSPVLMGVSMLRAQAPSKESEGVLNMVEGSARRGADMVKQVLAFARGGETDKTLIQVNQLVKEMGRIIADVFPKNIKFRVQAGKESWPVLGVPTQLHQVLMNLCVNARDAMPGGGTLTLTTSNAKLGPEATAKHPEVTPGNFLCTTVADTGTGIAPEQLEKIFQPFFTTKAPGKGTGLGLSTSWNIVRNHGGFMTVQSEPGRGTEFRFYLPAADVRETAGTPPGKVPLPAGAGECVLVVDDEESILAITRSTLENYGYQVLTAASGPEAVVCLAAKRDVVRLVITDLAMPLMDGHATLAAMRKIMPDIRAILMSGFEPEKGRDPLGTTNARAFIQKPFTAETLMTTVHRVLSGKA